MKKVAVISDISGLGKCSLSAALPVISAAGVQCCPVPTAVLTNQTDYDSYVCSDLTDMLPSFVKQWSRMNFTPDGILTGYIASEKQMDSVADFISEFKAKGAKIIVDPAMADNGQIYKEYTASMCDKMVSLCKTADVITPNLSEFCILTGADYTKIKNANINEKLDICRSYAKSLTDSGIKTVVITGIDAQDLIITAVVTKDSFSKFGNKRYADRFSGTGDIFSALLSAYIVRDIPIDKAVERIISFIEKSVNATVMHPFNPEDGIDFEKYLCEIM
ncbi:MAG: pyridoxamine kinase [Clostridiales bacterium]|nr:pyridoxamine kinase [Clostridiales bacterium]